VGHVIEVTGHDKYDGKSFKAIVFEDEDGDLLLATNHNDNAWDYLHKYKPFLMVKVGETDVLCHEPNADDSLDIARDYFSKPPSNYTPAVGDVVEFDDNGQIRKALIYLGKNGDIESLDDSLEEPCFWRLASELANPTKIREVSIIKDHTHWAKARLIAKAYFSKPFFKVGDSVKVVREGSVSSGHDIGTVAEVTGIGSDSGNLYIEGAHLALWHSPDSLELVPTPTFTGSYAEKQAQWIEYHGLEVGSKVRVVRKFEDDEGGSSCCEWNSSIAKGNLQEQVVFIRSIDKEEIVLTVVKGQYQGCGTFPYFALEPVTE
jgi:hypothetical protein